MVKKRMEKESSVIEEEIKPLREEGGYGRIKKNGERVGELWG